MNVTETISIKTVLRNTADELARLAAIATETDRAVGALTDLGVDTSARNLRSLQNVDLIRQSLESIEAILRNLAFQPHGNRNIPCRSAVKGVQLRSIRDVCLMGEAAPERAMEQVDNPDRLQLFFPD